MLNRWDPLAEIARLQGQMSRFAAPEMPGFRAAYNPAVDVFEEEKAFVVRAELPGLKAEDVHVNVENDVLTVRGERKLENADKRDGYQRIERNFGTFSRSFSLPKGIDAEHLEADMADGVLTIRIPKRAAPEPKRIEVKSGGAAKKVIPGQPS